MTTTNNRTLCGKFFVLKIKKLQKKELSNSSSFIQTNDDIAHTIKRNESSILSKEIFSGSIYVSNQVQLAFLSDNNHLSASGATTLRLNKVFCNVYMRFFSNNTSL